jgi:hypothetical protein
MMFIAKFVDRFKAQTGKAEKTPALPDVVVEPEAPKPPAKNEGDSLDVFFTKMDPTKQAPLIENAEIKEILAPVLAQVSAPVPPPAAAAVTSPPPAAPPVPSAKDDLMANIFQQEEKEENTALAWLINSLPELTIEELQANFSDLKALIQEAANAQLNEPEAQEVE